MALNDPDDLVEGADTASADPTFADLKSWVKASLEAHSEWYKESREAFDVVAGRQWDESEERVFEDTGRPAIKFNLVGPTINAVCGMEVNNRQEVKFLPRTMGDAQVNERLTDLADWARQECQAEDEESAAFRDNVICGRGATETRLDFEEEPTGKVVVDRRDPLECFVDPAASKANFADRKYGGDFRDLDTDEAEAMFPGVSWTALNATWARTTDIHDGGAGNKIDYPEETRGALQDNRRPRSVRVVRIQWWDRERAYMVAMPSGGPPQQVSSEEFEKGKAALEAAGQPVPSAQPIWVRKYKQAFLGSGAILPNPEGETIEEIDCFSLAFMTGTWDRNKRFHYGLVRPLLDPQRIVNKSLVQTHQILNTNAKGGLIIEKGAFANARDAEKDWSDPSKTIVVTDGGIARLKDRTAPPLPPALTSLLELSMSSIRNVTGVNLEILGAADRDQAASLEYQRRQSAMSILAPLFDAFRRYRKTQGYILIDCLRRLPPGVLVRVVRDEDMAAQEPQQGQMQPGGPEQPQQPQNPPQQAQAGPQAPKQAFQPFDPAYFGLDEQQARFDVVVDEAPSSPNQKEQTWSALQPFMAGLASNPGALAVALKYSPLPLAAASELSAAMTGGGLPPEFQQQMDQGKQLIDKLTQENQQLKTDRQIEAAKVQTKAESDAHANQTKQFSAETDRIHKVGQLGSGGGGDSDQIEVLKLQMQQQFEASEARQQRQFDLMLQHLKNAGQIAASRVRADATANQGMETNDEVGA